MNQVGASRLRGFVASLLALVLSVSVLSVVGGSPASAANTASEVLIDHDSNADTPRVRQFGGSNRYATSLALARAFAGSATISATTATAESIIVASGESLVDAAAAAGLAGSKSAPVVLTPPDRLSSALASFIVDGFISEVFIVGGTEAVSQEVEDEITALAPVRTVKRLEGEDRYATSAAMADEVGSPGDYCATGQVGAVVVNIDSAFADVIAVGPMAYALELPILLTSASGLSSDVTGYLTDAEIERVVVVGGTAAVPQAVVDQIIEAGVEDVTRISGATRYSTATEIRKALSECSTVTLDSENVALINGDSAADGVSAAPLLGRGLGEEGVTPALLVGTAGLPTETSDYLASIPARLGSNVYNDVALTAIGGTAAVSDEVMQAAIAAAITSAPLTATITAAVGQGTANVTFSANVNVDGPDDDGFATSALNTANYRALGSPLTVDDRITLTALRTVTITLGQSQTFTAGQTISVVDGRIKGRSSDNRRVEAVTHTVARAGRDTVRPRVDILAPESAREFRIVVTEDNLQSNLKIPDADLPGTGPIGPRRDSSLRTEVADELLTRIERNGVALSETNAALHPRTTQNASLWVCVNGYASGSCSAPDDDNPALSVGDRITVAAEAFVDTSGNPNRSETVTVRANTDRPSATRITVTSPTTYDNGQPAERSAVSGHRVLYPTNGPQLAKWAWAQLNRELGPTAVSGQIAMGVNILTITARADGIAAGAAGNDWFVSWYELPRNDDGVPEVEVDVSERRKTIRIGFDREATVLSVVQALLENDEVTEIFDVTSDASEYESIANWLIPRSGSPSSETEEFGCVTEGAVTASGAVVGIGSWPASRTDTSVASVAPLTWPEIAEGEDGHPASVAVTNVRGAPCPEPRAFQGGVSSVTLTLTYNNVLQRFQPRLLRDANAGMADFPETAGWLALSHRPVPRQLRLFSEFSIILRSDDLSELPTSGSIIDLPANLGENFSTAPNGSLADDGRRLRPASR